MRKPTTRRHGRRRSGAVRLDPYALDETTITLQEWRRLNQPARPSQRSRAATPPLTRAA